MGNLKAIAGELADAVNGINWDANRVQDAIDEIHSQGQGASSAELDAAMVVLVERLQRFCVDDADGVAHVAMTGGTLIEFGGAAQPLADVLLEIIPLVLRAARRYADTCLADPRTPHEEVDESETIVTKVDQRAIIEPVFRHYLDVDRPGGAALYNLEHWTLAAVTAWTRARKSLIRAINDRDLVELADQLGESEAHWLRTLLGAQLDATWLVLCPLQSRGFRLLLDGITTNQDLHMLLGAALVPLGIDGKACSKTVIAYLEGRGAQPRQRRIKSTWTLFDYRAARFDLRHTTNIPTEYTVSEEELPIGVPALDGERTLLVGPPSRDQAWDLFRIFEGLSCQLTVQEELSSSAFQAESARVIAASEKNFSGTGAS